jgi:1,5-anhydro-D-fructose reductase (1,5-anhydro-D-mannitol-forming)
MMNYKFGIIGYGKMGKIRHQAINELKVGEVVAISEPSISSAPNNIYLGTHDEILNNSNIDAIFICTPNFLNKDLTIRALQSGKHVFCEKPPCFTGPEMDEILQIEGMNKHLKLMYGFNHRHHDSIIRMKDVVDKKSMGRVLWMRGRYGKSVEKEFYEDWRSKKELSGGGILIDQGIHMLDLFLFLGGEFDQIKADVTNSFWNLDVEDNAFVILKNSKNKMSASMHSTMTQWRHLFSLEVFLEKGHMILNGLITTSMAYGEEILSVSVNSSTSPEVGFSDEVLTKYTDNNSWRHEVTHFVNAINEDKPISIGNSSDALQLMNVIDKIYEQKDF